jgi:predicted transcriptional regulator
MLSDIERKVLRILWNFNAGRRRLPTLHELSVKTGRREATILPILKRLAEQEYIEWDGSNVRTVIIKDGWDREGPIKPVRPIKTISIDYSRFLG